MSGGLSATRRGNVSRCSCAPSGSAGAAVRSTRHRDRSRRRLDASGGDRGAASGVSDQVGCWSPARRILLIREASREDPSEKLTTVLSFGVTTAYTG